jgi:hypothetical protein
VRFRSVPVPMRLGVVLRLLPLWHEIEIRLPIHVIICTKKHACVIDIVTLGN